MKLNVIKKMLTMLLPVLLLLTLLPIGVFAAEADSKVEVRLKAGSTTVKINGTDVKGVAPYVSNGTTMVPLKVITNAFGAALKLENGKDLTLTYNDRKVEMSFGSKTVKVNGVVKTVAVAPISVQGSTMVPLRVIVEAFGAKISADNVTKETVIVGVRGVSSSSGGTSIDSDIGKTKVGDSHYGWSLKYPASLIQVLQTDNGDHVKWADSADDFKASAQVNVMSVNVGDDELTTEEQRDLLISYYFNDEITVDQSTLNAGGFSYEKVISYAKESKMYFEYRGIQKEDMYYIVIVGTKGANKSVLGSYDTLLKSFTPSFDKEDKALKDITKVKDGQLTFKDADYGFTVKLPADWSSNLENETLTYENATDTLSFSFSSASEGITSDNWATRIEQRIREEYIASSVRNIKTSPITLKDGKANMLSYELSVDGKYWYTYHEFAIITGKYEYSFFYTYPSQRSEQSKKTFDQAMASVDIDTAFVEKTYGEVDKNVDFIDRSKKIAKRSSTYGYSIEIPAYWYAEQGNFNEDEVLYSINGGNFNVYESDESASALSATIAKHASSPEGIAAEVTNKASNTVTINGKTAQYLVVHTANDEEESPYSEIFYIFDTPKGSIVFTMGIYDYRATESNMKAINDTIQSIRFN